MRVTRFDNQGMKHIQLTVVISAIDASKPLSESCSDPSRRTNPSVQVLHFARECGCDLDATAANAHDSDSLASKIGRFIGMCAVHQFSFEKVESFDIWPFPFTVIESASCCTRDFLLTLGFHRH
jgi:hypothetical protein